MNPCIKTGAHVYLTAYDEYAYGDAFCVQGVYIFRIVCRSREPIMPRLHFTVDAADAKNSLFFHDHGKDTIITAHVTVVGGYDGEPIIQEVS